MAFCLFVCYFVCLREVKNHLPSNDSLSQDDFVLMTLFPQRIISDMESTLESAGKTVQCRLHSNYPECYSCV